MPFITTNQFLKRLDIVLSPPKNYATLTYKDRFKALAQDTVSFRGTAKSFLFFIMLTWMLGMSYVLWPIAWILKRNDYHFVDIDLDQIGSVTYLDLLLRENTLETKTPRRKMLALASYYADGNRYLFDLYKERVTFIRNPFVKFLLSPFFVSDVFSDDSSYRFDFVYHTKTGAHKIWNRYLEQYQKPLIKVPEADLESAKEILSPYVQKDTPFVTLHVRDNGFYNIASQNTRNADIQTYKAAIQYLIDQGNAVIRLGDANMVEITDLIEQCGPMLFDYAHSDIKSEMMDCYFLSQSAFVIGCASGPSSVPPVFGVNCVNVNWYNASNAPYFLVGDLTTFKKFRYIKDNSLVALEELMKPPFSFNPSQKTLDDLGVRFEDNTEQEILDTVKEFLDHEERTTSALQRKAKALIRPENYAFGAKGNYSNTILKNYFKGDAVQSNNSVPAVKNGQSTSAPSSSAKSR